MNADTSDNLLTWRTSVLGWGDGVNCSPCEASFASLLRGLGSRLSE
jgi:hypothetical protein